MSIDLNNLDSINAALAQLRAQTATAAVAVMEPKTEVAAPVSEPEELTQGPFTEKEAIKTVQSWVTEDTDYELSEQRTFEEMVSNLQEAAEYRTSNVPPSRFVEIVKQYAPNAPHKNEVSESNTLPQTVAAAAEPQTEVAAAQSEVREPAAKPYPTELEPLVTSGVAHFTDGHWFGKKCMTCQKFILPSEECSEHHTYLVPLVRLDDVTLTTSARRALGLEKPKSAEEVSEQKKKALVDTPWWSQFRSAGELEGTGNVKMYVENFLPEGITIISGLPKEGKSFLGLSIAKALTTGKPLFGRRNFEVPDVVPVLYLAAESGDGALKLRCKKFGITEDKTLFICRTLSQGLMLGLDDAGLEQLIRWIQPVVILETMIRFNDGKDEDSSTENRKLAEGLFRLLAWGAKAVIGIHHSRKDLDKSNPTKESAVRGSGDGLAMVDCVWLVMQDEKLFQGGKGPNEVDVVGWGRDFNPVPMRLALTRKANLPPGVISFAPGIVSCIDATGNFEWVDRQAVVAKRQAERQDLDQVLVRLVAENPLVTRKELAEAAGRSEWEVRKALKRLGYHRSKSRKSGESRWEKSDA